MAYTFDFPDDGRVIEWHRHDDGIERVAVEEYTKTIYVDGPDEALTELSVWLEPESTVVRTARCSRYPDLHVDTRSSVLGIELVPSTNTRHVAAHIREAFAQSRYAPGTFSYYNVDLTPQFRYCLETGIDPTPATDLRNYVIKIDEKRLADRDVSELTVDGETLRGSEPIVVESLAHRLNATDPDVLTLSHGDLVPLLLERAAAHEVDLQLGRKPGYRKLAGKSTYESYGRVGHSPARYSVPGRAIVDISNSFLWTESDLDGLLDLVDRSHKPLQETSWASIGNVFTAIQIREAFDRDILVPWNKWEPETFKDLRTLHAADRGGFTIDPEVGFHEDVYEVDFSSLYPNIMVEYNISPDTILCACHADRNDIPVLDYNVCDERGFLADVLEPMLEDREEMKREIRIREETDGEDAETGSLRARSAAIKWILVSCFGYQGYRNAKFGRIECHEAINAVAREIFLESKAILEQHGWHVVHGIVDSLWVTPASDRGTTPIEKVIPQVTDVAGIALEFEEHYEWVCFVPRRNSRAGALTKYFAKIEDEDAFKIRGIEARQRSTPPFIETAQRELLTTLDANRDPESVIDYMEQFAQQLHNGNVDPSELVITTRVSKSLDEYSQRTLSVAALQRANQHDMSKQPGEDVRYIVVDDEARTSERVRLPFETVAHVDAEYYESLLVRATESLVSPLGWTESDIERYRSDRVDTPLSMYE